ncbi:MAG TPA: hypothetical protein DD791_05640 [Syntrophomonas sp.]|nr:hypothetical protein [Syntrophomonas sp.]
MAVMAVCFFPGNLLAPSMAVDLKPFQLPDINKPEIPEIKPDAPLEVKFIPTNIKVTPDSQSIKVGQTASYKCMAYDANNSSRDVTDICSWHIKDPDIAANRTGGEYLGVSAGETIVYAILDEYKLDSNDCALIVTDAGTPLLVIEPSTATILVEETQQYRAYLRNTLDNYPNQDVTDECTWTIGSDSIAIVETPGLFKGTGAGNISVSAHYYKPDLTAEARLTVNKALEKPQLEETPPVTEPYTAPATENLPEGKILDRQPGYITLAKPQKLGNPGVEFFMDFNQNLMGTNPDRHPKIIYWNKTYSKWVALASYLVASGKVKGINDGNYEGWFVVMGCIQPTFIDIGGHWADKITNRVNGLGLLEGYPDPTNPSSLTRTADLERIIIRSELTTTVAKILGLAPGDTHLYPTITYMTDWENDQVLQSKYTDAAQIPEWARPYIAGMTKAGLVSGKGNRFAPNDQLTRIEAAVIISNALRDVPGFGTPADLTVYTDSAQIPEWAIGKVAQGTIGGYPDGTLRPNQPIKRGEALTLLLTLLRGLGW